MKAEEYLEDATKAFRQGEFNHRNVLIGVGRKLHQFILSSLEESLAVSHREAKLVTRERLMTKAAESLQVKTAYIARLIRTAMTVELLSDGAPLGEIGMQSLTTMSKFIRRKTGAIGRTPSGSRGKSEAEEWLIKEGMEEQAKKTFARAVKSKWSSETTRAKVSSPRILDDEQEPSRQGEIPGNASPGDAAERCIEIILANDDPQAVVACLLPRLNKFNTNRKRLSLQEVLSA